jgi:hypothetical protein
MEIHHQDTKVTMRDETASMAAAFDDGLVFFVRFVVN